MRCLIRHITRKGQDGLVHQDHEVEAPRLKLGRGAECDVFLSDIRVALDHAVLAPSEGRSFILHSNAASGVRIDQEVHNSAEIAVGSRFRIGGFEISLVEPPPGFDLQLEVEQVEAGQGRELETALRQRSVLRLADAGWRRRRWSWAGFLLVLLTLGLLPLAGFMLPGLGTLLRDAPLPDDGVWDPGELAGAHRFFGENCNRCHQQAFVQVRNQACTDCHRQTRQHAEADRLGPHSSLHEARCGSCHKDHKGVDGLVLRDPGLCTDCHADIEAEAADTRLLNVSDFGDAHPEFRPTLLRVEAGQTLAWRLPLDAPQGLEERSNLRFPHRLHLTTEGVETAAGDNRVLDCGDCHRPERGGRGMQPIRFTDHCHECHRLDFDATAPAREVPHAEPEAVLEALEAYYLARALEDGYAEASAPEVVRRLRRPGAELKPEERASALAWLREKSRDVAGEVFEFRACATCHEVQRGLVETAAGSRPAWTVTPVRISRQWLPLARFSHARHTTMDCADCHAAAESERSEDILLPRIAGCRECHGGSSADDRLASTCIDCHGFHNADAALFARAGD